MSLYGVTASASLLGIYTLRVIYLFTWNDRNDEQHEAVTMDLRLFLHVTALRNLPPNFSHDIVSVMFMWSQYKICPNTNETLFNFVIITNVSLVRSGMFL
jgi:hypothetical protein